MLAKSILCAFAFLMATKFSYADTDQKKIPVISKIEIDKRISIEDSLRPLTIKNASKSKVDMTSAMDMVQTIKILREDVCTSLQEGDTFKFTMTWDASLKIWGLGVSGSSGVEVTIKC